MSGKTAVAELLRSRFGWPIIEADRIGRSVTLDEPDFLLFPPEADGAEHHFEYPYDDALLVEWERPDCFRRHLTRAMETLQPPVLLVGLRSLKMLRMLRSAYPQRVHLLYVAAGRRVCSARYAARTGGSRSSYCRLLEYAVENDQDALRRTARLVVTNCSTLEALGPRLFARIRGDGRISRSRLEYCVYCGTFAPVHFRTTGERAPVCRECYELHYNSERCSVCRRHRPVHKRFADGRSMCKSCYQKVGNIQPCAHCGAVRPVDRRNERGEPLCRRCSRHLFKN
jgi:hypothetical protein